MARSTTITRRRTIITMLVLGSAACGDDPGPTALDPPVTPPEGQAELPQLSEGSAIFSDRTHRFPTDGFDLLSTPQELESGLYRFRATDGALPDAIRDDFIIPPSDSDSMVVRRVLQSRMEAGELIMETGHAYMHEVIRSGSYTVTMPIDGIGDGLLVSEAPELVTYHLPATNFELQPLETVFDEEVDVCRWIHEVLALIPGSATREVCGTDVDFEVAYGVSLAATGRLDSLRILDGNVRVTGDADITMTIDGGAISGGRAPTFSPCNTAAYVGCLRTPTGAALIDFLRRYAPAIPEASLPAIRVCLPGTPIRIRRGYWSGFTYNPPVWRTCAVTDSGELPTVVLPSVQAAASIFRPRVQGELTVRVKGDGVFALELPIPYLAIPPLAYGVTNDFKAKLKVGVFLRMQASLLNSAATVKLVFDDTGRTTQSWTPTDGWGRDFELTDKSNHAELLALDNPDSVVVRVEVPVKAKAELCVALLSACGNTEEEGGDPEREFELEILNTQLIGRTGIAIGVNAGVGVSMFQEGIYTRDQIHPDSAAIDNWHLSVEGGYDLFVNAGLHIPLTGWIRPDVPREYENRWECCRVSVSDYWGQGRLQVSTTTTGVDPDPDGYSVAVQRADTLPAILDPGAERIGNGWGRPLHEEAIGADGLANFGHSVVRPCIAVYSDAFIVGNPVWGLAVAGARAAGIGIPTYGSTSPCRWLIGRYEVTLSGVAENCSVVGGAVRDSVWLTQARLQPPRGDTTYVHFDVECETAGPQGSLEVVLPPGVRDPNGPPHALLDGVMAGVFPVSDTLTLSNLVPGSYSLTLGDLSPLCTADPLPVTVVAGQLSPAAPNVVCNAPPQEPWSVRYTASFTGSLPDQNGYRLTRDGMTAAFLPVDGSGTATGLTPATPTVFMVTDIAGNCQPQATNPTLITVDSVQNTVELPFPVRCTAEKPDTLIGTLDASGWPALTVTMRATDGTTLVVNGPQVDELARLTGTSVRVWGQVSATGINVHGYDLRSTVGDDRWLGIVLDRADGTWLFGEEAIRLVDPPASLIGASGNLVWVMGHEVVGGVQPTLYGVIRGGE